MKARSIAGHNEVPGNSRGRDVVPSSQIEDRHVVPPVMRRDIRLKNYAAIRLFRSSEKRYDLAHVCSRRVLMTEVPRDLQVQPRREEADQ